MNYELYFENIVFMETNRNRRLWIRLNDKEYERLMKDSANYRSLSDYMRQKLFNTGVMSPVEYIKIMDEICLELKRIGNNINQIAKYVNQHKESINSDIMREIENALSQHVEVEKKLNVTWRKLMNNK